MDMRSIILTSIATVASEQDKTLAPLTDDLVLLNSGLDSLCFAILVTRLEDELGFDSFTISDDVYFYWLGELQALRAGRWKMHLAHDYPHVADPVLNVRS